MSASSEHPPVRSEIPAGLVCAQCGYNLSSASSEGACPECGLPVWSSVARWTDPRQRGLDRMRKSLQLGGGSSIAYAVALAMAGVMLLIVDPTQIFMNASGGGAGGTPRIEMVVASMIAGCFMIVTMVLWWISWIVATSARAVADWPTVQPSARVLKIGLWTVMGLFILSMCGGLAVFIAPKAPMAFAVVVNIGVWTTFYCAVRFVQAVAAAVPCEVRFLKHLHTITLVVLVASTLLTGTAMIVQEMPTFSFATMGKPMSMPTIPPTPIALRLAQGIVGLVGAVVVLGLGVGALRIAKAVPTTVRRTSAVLATLASPLVPPTAPPTIPPPL